MVSIRMLGFNKATFLANVAKNLHSLGTKNLNKLTWKQVIDILNHTKYSSHRYQNLHKYIQV